MRALLDVFLHPFTREEICLGVKWMLRLAGACYMQAAFVKYAMNDTAAAYVLLGISAGFLAVSAVKFYWLLLLAISGWTAFLVIDFLARRNPFSVIFAVVCLFHIYKMIRWRTGRAEDIQ